MAVYSSGGLHWKEVGDLPSAGFSLQAAMVGDVLHVTGGWDGSYPLTSILAWDPVAESWQDAGRLNVARYCHAAVAVPDSIIKCP